MLNGKQGEYSDLLPLNVRYQGLLKNSHAAIYGIVAARWNCFDNMCSVEFIYFNVVIKL